MADPLPPTATSNGEAIGFRFTLLLWALGALALAVSIMSFVQWRIAVVEVDENLKSFQACEAKLEVEHPTCRVLDGNHVNFDQCMSLRDQKCGHRFFEASVERSENWLERAELSLYAAIGLLAVPAILFYALRWAVTGRVRPWWVRL